MNGTKEIESCSSSPIILEQEGICWKWKAKGENQSFPTAYDCLVQFLPTRGNRGQEFRELRGNGNVHGKKENMLSAKNKDMIWF